MFNPGNQRYTIYDAMEAKGTFAANTANTSSGPNYVKQELPCMLYHPEGALRVTDPGEIIATLLGPKEVGKKTELVSRIVETQAELEDALAEGWHRHPARAHAAAGRAAAPVSSAERIAELEAALAVTQRELAEAKESME